jgi:hypothetical protein
MSTNKELIDKLLKASELIHQQSLQPKANFIVCSAKVAEMIQNLDIRRLRKKKLLEINKKASE